MFFEDAGEVFFGDYFAIGSHSGPGFFWGLLLGEYRG